MVDVTEQTWAAVPAGCLTCTYWQGGSGADRAAMFANGRLRGKLALDADGTAMGFVQYGPLEALPAFSSLRRAFDVGAPPEGWAITCLITGKEHRGRGVAKSLLRAVVAEAAVEGRPLEAIGMEEADLERISVGPAHIYIQGGFAELGRLRDRHGVNVLFRLTQGA